MNARADIVVVGGGPAGLSAAIEMRRLGAGRVVVVEREHAPGGIPRHSSHTGFGLRDLHRLLSGPRYAAALTRRAEQAGVEIRTSTMATGWRGERTLELTAEAGVELLNGRAVLLTTGCRERPRSARLVAGDRPEGVLTTGLLQQAVAHRDPRVAGRLVGRTAVVVGAEHVSYSAVETLAHAGCRTIAMTTESPRHATFGAFHLGSASRRRVPLHTGTRVTDIIGAGRVTAVIVEELGSGRQRCLDCDTVVFTGGWVPDHELARTGGLASSGGWPGPATDQWGRTTRPGVFAAGNLLHGAEAADRCALEGRIVAAAIAGWLRDTEWPAPPIDVVPGPGVAWVWPARLTGDGPGPRMALRLARPTDGGRIVVRQGGRILHAFAASTAPRPRPQRPPRGPRRARPHACGRTHHHRHGSLIGVAHERHADHRSPASRDRLG